MAPSTALPEKMKALVLESTAIPPTIQSISTPQPTFGSAVVKILSAGVISYTRDVCDGTRKYRFPKPLVPGFSAIGRIAAVGPDATKLKAGDLVFVDCMIRSRDQPEDVFLAAASEGHTDGSRKLMSEVFRDWTYAEYARAPLEVLHLLDEARLLGQPSGGGRGYEIYDLAYMSTLLVPFGGLKDIGLQPGQTVIVTPATGPFGGAAVLVALAMGARVIAMGRNKTALTSLKRKVPFPERVETVPITGDMEADCAELKKFGEIDAFFDIGPPEACTSTHLKSAILALKHGARISLMGGYREDVKIPHAWIMHRNIRLYGKWMYEREDIVDFIKLVEGGMMELVVDRASRKDAAFQLDRWKEAFDMATEYTGLGQFVVLQPSK